MTTSFPDWLILTSCVKLCWVYCPGHEFVKLVLFHKIHFNIIREQKRKEKGNIRTLCFSISFIQLKILSQPVYKHANLAAWEFYIVFLTNRFAESAVDVSITILTLVRDCRMDNRERNSSLPFLFCFLSSCYFSAY